MLQHRHQKVFQEANRRLWEHRDECNNRDHHRKRPRRFSIIINKWTHAIRPRRIPLMLLWCFSTYISSSLFYQLLSTEEVTRHLRRSASFSPQNDTMIINATTTRLQSTARAFSDSFSVLFTPNWRGNLSLCQTLDSSMCLSIFKLPKAVLRESLFNDTDTFGGLQFDFFEEEGQRRTIFHDYDLDDRKEDRPLRSKKTDVERYYAFDDDQERSDYITLYNNYVPEAKSNKLCRRTKWYRFTPLNCNSFHELDLVSLQQHGDLLYVS